MNGQHRLLARRTGVASLVLIACGGTAVSAETKQTATAGIAFRVGKIITMDEANTVVNNAVVLVKDGRVERPGSAVGCRRS